MWPIVTKAGTMLFGSGNRRKSWQTVDEGIESCYIGVKIQNL